MNPAAWTVPGETDVEYLGHIGSGASGHVYSVSPPCLSLPKHLQLRLESGIKFARKVVPKREVTVLQREVEAIRNLGDNGPHKNIIAILKHGDLDKQHHYIDMEFCNFDLRHLIYAADPPADEFKCFMNPSRRTDDIIWHIVEDISRGVAFIHSRDFLYSATDEAWKIADFGLTVQRTGAQETLYGRGTPGYRAPELINNQESRGYSEKVDIWAMGCMFYEVLFRTSPFGDDFKATKGQNILQFDEDRASLLNGRLRAILIGVIRNSLNMEPSNRPSASKIYSTLVPSPLVESLSDILHESMSELLHFAVNFTNIRIVTVNKIKETNWKLVHQLWNVETGAVICRREQLYFGDLPCYADFSVDGLEVWFYDFFTITIINAVTGTIQTVLMPPATSVGNSGASIRAFAISKSGERMAMATCQSSRQTVGHAQRIIDEFEIPSAESVSLLYTQDGLYIFTVYTTWRRGKRELTVQCRDFGRRKSPTVKISPNVDSFKVIGGIRFDGQQWIVLVVTESMAREGRWIVVSTGCDKGEIHPSRDEEIINSGGRLLRVDLEGCIREWPGGSITGYFRRLDQSKKTTLVAVNVNSKDVIFLSESGRWIIEKMKNI